MALKRTAIRCPHCNEPARVASSVQLSPLVRESYYDCTDVVDCGHRFVAVTSIDRTIVPSLKERADINLPIVQRRANDIIVSPPRAEHETPATDSRPAPAKPHQHGAVPGRPYAAH